MIIINYIWPNRISCFGVLICTLSFIIQIVLYISAVIKIMSKVKEIFKVMYS